MSLHVIALPDLVIPNAGTDSNILLAHGLPTAPNMATTGDGFRDADSITIFAPDTLPETVTVQVDSSETAVNFNPLFRGAADVTVPAGKAITIELLSFKALKVVAGAGVAAQRTFKVNKNVWI
jgi:hypothetical protein